MPTLIAANINSLLKGITAQATKASVIVTTGANINITLSAVNALNQVRINLESNSKSNGHSSK